MSFYANTSGLAAEAAAPREESVMGVAIPGQDPAVVLRSQFNKLRALLAVALIAVAGLTVAVVLVANDSDTVSSTGSTAAKPVEKIHYGDSSVNPSTGYPSADLRPESHSSRYEGGPVSRYEAEGKYFSVPSTRGPASEAKHEAATAAAIGQSSDAGDEWGTAQYRLARP